MCHTHRNFLYCVIYDIFFKVKVVMVQLFEKHFSCVYCTYIPDKE